MIDYSHASNRFIRGDDYRCYSLSKIASRISMCQVMDLLVRRPSQRRGGQFRLNKFPVNENINVLEKVSNALFIFFEQVFIRVTRPNKYAQPKVLSLTSNDCQRRR